MYKGKQSFGASGQLKRSPKTCDIVSTACPLVWFTCFMHMNCEQRVCVHECMCVRLLSVREFVYNYNCACVCVCVLILYCVIFHFI